MPFARVEDAAVFFTDEGKGTPVVLVHGWTGDSNDWIWQIPALRERHRVIAVDLRGHGRSEVTAGGYRVARLAGDVASLIDQLGLDAPAVVGHGLGASVANWIAVEQLAPLRGIATLDGTYGFGPEISGEFEQLREALRTEAAREVLCRLFEGAFHRPTTPAALLTWHLRRIAAMPPEVLSRTFEGFAFTPDQFVLRPQAERFLARRKVPVLAFRTHPDSAAWESRFFSADPSQSICWEGVGHFLHQERPEDTNRALLAWLGALPG